MVAVQDHSSQVVRDPGLLNASPKGSREALEPVYVRIVEPGHYVGDGILQTVCLEKSAVAGGRDGEARRYRKAGAGQAPEAGGLAADGGVDDGVGV